MIDPENLQTASFYVNNQLLSRGLLRDGQHIDFAALGYGNGDGLETSQKIISLVNDLILRRDRDAEQRESLSNALRDLGAENLKNTGDVSRLTEKAAEAQRRLDIASTSEASMRTQLKSAESAMRGLRDELARTKALVSQTRASCATEIKRRDRQIDTLKKQVAEAGRTRGAKANSAIMTITVAGDVGSGGGDEKNQSSRDEARGEDDSSLRNETNGFLASMVQGLGEENESLLRTIKETTDRLREMSGWTSDKNEDVQVIRQPGWEELSLELHAVMDHMRSILTNPSFVPIEEVIVREEEINQLKAGWLKMESRWEDAVHLMDTWRKRMAVNGKPVDEEDLKIGMSLSPVRIKNIEETRFARKPGYLKLEQRHEGDPRAAQPLRLGSGQSGPEDEYDDGEGPGDDESEFNGFDDEIPTDEYGVQIIEPHAASTYQREPSQASSPLPEPPQLSPLKNSSSAGNRGHQTTEVQENPKMAMRGRETARAGQETALGTGKPLPHRAAFFAGAAHQSRSGHSSGGAWRTSQSIRSEGPLFPVEHEAANNTQREEKPKRTGDEKSSSFSQNPRRGARLRSAQAQTSDPPSQSRPLTTSTITAKLASSQREADAAKVRPRVRPTRAISVSTQRSAVSPTEDPPNARADMVTDVVKRREEVEPMKRDSSHASDGQKPEKRKRDRRPARTTSRRRSSLIPAEVERLIAGNAP